MQDASLRSSQSSSTHTPQDLTHHAIDCVSAALLDLQLAMRNLPEDHPVMETLRYAVTQLTDVGAALFVARDALAS
jgi:hypothetical protein